MHQALRSLVLLAILLALPMQGLAAVMGCTCFSHSDEAPHTHLGDADGPHDHHDGGNSHAASGGCSPCCCTPAGITATVFRELPRVSFTVSDKTTPLAFPGTPPDELYRPPLAA